MFNRKPTLTATEKIILLEETIERLEKKHPEPDGSKIKELKEQLSKVKAKSRQGSFTDSVY